MVLDGGYEGVLEELYQRTVGMWDRSMVVVYGGDGDDGDDDGDGGDLS